MSPYQPIPVYSPEQINAMSDRDFKTYEARLRRAVARQGYGLSRSRARDPRAIDYGKYRVVDPNTTAADAWDMDIDDVARWVNGDK